MLSDSNVSQDFYEIAIIGAGFAGVGAGIKLKERGDHSFIIFEKSSSIGGTWRDNTYPGCACDIPSFLYSYSFEPNPDWTRTFSRQGEILEYLKACTEKYGIYKHIQFQTEIKEVRFLAEEGLWEIWDTMQNCTKARVIISATGPFNTAFFPDIKGRANFEGESFHSMYWNHDLDLKGKKVAVIGTGASAVQFIPEIAKEVEELYIFQRTPPWIQPKPETIFTEKEKERFRKYPWNQRFWREFIYYFLENRGRAHFGNKKMREKRQKEALRHLHNSVSDPILREKLTPKYEIGCKRVLISEDYYPALQEEHVHLITDAIAEIQPTGIQTEKGESFPVDLIIYGTGFYTTEFPKAVTIKGLEAKNLHDSWKKEGAEAYYGIAVSGYPNLLFMVGPNSGLGHNSIIHQMESQLNFILDYVDRLRQTPTPQMYYDLKIEAQEAFNEKIQKKLGKMVWSDGGCKSYYLLNNEGKNTSLWPGSTISYRRQTRRVNFDHFRLLGGNGHKNTRTKGLELLL